MAKPYPLIAGKSIWDMTQEDFLFVTKSLYRRPDTKASQAVAGVSLSFTETKSIVRVSREPKELNLDEVMKLSLEYGQPVESLITLLQSRKVGIRDDKGQLLERPKKPRKAKKGNVEPEQTA